MFLKIPFEQEIKFDTNIYEISKMSLEHDFNINDSLVLGNFYLDGEYRTHEVSVNKEPFNFTLPFSVDVSDDLIKESLEFNIEDFSYEIIDKDTMKVNIEYSLKGELRKEEDNLFEEVDEDELNEELDFIDNFMEEKKELNSEKEETLVVEETDERVDMEDEKTIMETIKDSDDTFVTYHIHIVSENETIETICTKYNITNSLLSEYNSLDSITIGDKILIPKIDE